MWKRLSQVLQLWLVCALLASPALAQGKKVKAKPKPKARAVALTQVAILPGEIQGFPAAWNASLQDIQAKSLADVGLFKMVPQATVKKKIAWWTKKKVYRPDCHKNPKCIRTVAGATKAKLLFFFSLAKEGEQAKITVRVVDVKSGKLVKEVVEIVAADQKAVEQMARWAVKQAASPMITTLSKGKGRLEVKCNHADADLIINGRNFGAKTGKSLKVSAGTFDIEVKKEGLLPFRDVVVVLADVDRVVDVQLEPDTAATLPLADTTALVPPVGEPGKEPVATAPTDTKPGDGKTPSGALPAAGALQTPPADATKPKDTQVAAIKPLSDADLPKPFLAPKDESLMRKEPGRIEEGDEFYETWWFWTIVGVAVAGGGATATYFALSGGGTSSVPTGSAVLTWE